MLAKLKRKLSKTLLNFLTWEILSEGHRQGMIYGTAFAFSQACVFLIYAAAFRFGAHLVQVGIMTPLNVYRYT